MKKRTAPSPCPCGSGRPYADCCRLPHEGTIPADAEASMRSRYSAYVFKLEAYLRATWHPSTRPQRLDLDDDGATTKWLGLEVERHEITGPDQAIVEFTARYKIGGRAQRLHEVSRFVRENGQWYYLDAENKRDSDH
ncbi:MAG: YchJ family protein [Sterolibacterium sp.]